MYALAKWRGCGASINERMGFAARPPSITNKTKKIMKKKDEFKPQAGYCLSNLGGIQIEVNDCGDMVRYQWYDLKPSMRWLPIRYNMKGDPFFVARGQRWYLSNFMRYNVFH
jgi:hypothetical protein